MIHSKLYRINEYRISEFADGRLWWDAHSSLGKQIGGPCLVYGNMLVLGTRCSEEDGFLKLEFFNQLKRLSFWHKTRYYCFISALRDVSSGTNISEQKLQQLISLSGRTDTDSENIVRRDPGKFRLWQYQISIAPCGNIIWKTCGGMGQVFGGPAIIESDVVFLGPKKFDDPRKKRDFLHSLRTLPKWGQTNLWCRSLALKPILSVEQDKPIFSLPKKEKLQQQTRIVSKSHHSKFAKQAWSLVKDYYSNTVDEMKARWPKGVILKRKKRRKVEDKFD